MHTLRPAYGALVVLAVLIAGCGNPHDPASGDAGTGTTPASFCAGFATRICAGLSACGCRFDVRAYDADGCVAARAAACTASLETRLGPDLAAGRARFHEPAVTACLDAVAAMAGACALAHGTSAPLPDACRAYVVATASLGDTCQLGGGLAFCGADADGLCVPGESAATCTALPGSGAPCLNGQCAAGLACNADICAAPAASDAACSDSAACQDPLICDPTGHCAAPLAAAATCTDTAQCQAGLTCADGACTEVAVLGDGCGGPTTCGAGQACGRAPETRTCTDPDGAGAACMDTTCAAGLDCADTSMTCVALPGDGAPCLDGFACAAGLTCADGVGTCAPLPGVGQTCAVGNRFCADGLGCRPSDNTCQPGPGLGQECYQNPPDYVCGAGLGCDFAATGSVCIAVGGEGDACITDRTCSADTFCDFATLRCTARLAAGAACSAGNECQPGDECELRAAGPSCAPIPGRGEPCFSACSGGLTCKGPGGECVPELCTIP